jgi:lysophospholipase L1-like esterase
MSVRGKNILIFGDSLSTGATSPGGVFGAVLKSAGAVVRVNGKVSRSAVNLWSGANGENGAAVVAAEAARRPDIVIVVLGTNDLGMNASADQQAFARLAAAFAPAELWAVGPPSFPATRADLTRKAPQVYATLAAVFGAHRVIDWQRLTADVVTPEQGRARDGVHFATAGAAVAGKRLAAAWLQARTGVTASAAPAFAASGFSWPLTLGALGAAAVMVGVAVVVRRRRQLSGLGRVAAPPTSEPRTLLDYDAVPKRDRKILGDEIDGAVVRAVKAGAGGPLEYMGAGAEGIVFCDGNTAYKAGRQGRGSLAMEAAFFEQANKVPGAREHVARFKRYDEANDVLVRECARGAPLKWTQAHKAYDLNDALAKVMAPYGFTAPERKPGNWVMVRGRGPTLIDGGFAYDRGQKLVKRVLDVINGRRPRQKWLDDNTTLIQFLEHERDQTVPSKVVDKLIARLQAMEPQDPVDVARRRLDAKALGTPTVTIKTTKPWAEYGDDMDVNEWVVEDEDKIDGVELRSRDNPKHYALAHRATTGDRWQVTWFDEHGPGGDVRHPTLLAALTDGASSNEYVVETVHVKASRGGVAGAANVAGTPQHKYKRAAARVDDRGVRDEIPNTSSIDGALSNYEVLPGVREVPFTAFDQLGPLRYYSTSEEKRTKQLAAQIRASGEINPLIVVEDAEGPYILEGGHRFDALRELGAKAFPALVVLDLDSLATRV